MTTAAENLNSLMLAVIIGFASLNLFINGVLLAMFPKKIYRLLCAYWFSVLLAFVFNWYAAQEPLAVISAFGFEIVPIVLFAYVIFDALQHPFPFRMYGALFLLSCLLTAWLAMSGVSFTVMALPFALITAAPMVHAAFLALIQARSRTGLLHRLYGAIAILIAVQCLNFAFFRMVVGTQLWGWLFTFALAQLLSILLPAFALDELGRQERRELEKLVALRSLELEQANGSLSQAVQINTSLLRTVLHDISNPLYVVLGVLPHVRSQGDPENEDALLKMKNSADMIRDVIAHVREYELLRSGGSSVLLGPVDLQSCLNDVCFLLQERLRQKTLEIRCTGGLKPGAHLLADQRSFVYGVLHNILSNSINHSFPESDISIHAAQNGGHEIMLAIEDSGAGMPEAVLGTVFDVAKVRSRIGPDGELWSGFGMPLAKFYVDSYGGTISIDSRDIERHPDSHGTKVILTLRAC